MKMINYYRRNRLIIRYKNISRYSSTRRALACTVFLSSGNDDDDDDQRPMFE